MCGRFVLMTPGKDWAKRFGLEEIADLEPHYNIAPTQMVAAIRVDRHTHQRHLVKLKWGLVPYWVKDPSMGNRLINAKAESLAEKPSFRSAFRFRRCLVLADGFYQWKTGNIGKQPYLFKMADGSTFAFAGLWERWTRPGGETIESCTLITTDANQIMEPIHDRMPVIIKPQDYELWLDLEIKDPNLLKPLLRPYPSEEMIRLPVNPKVNKATYDSPDCVEELPAKDDG
jgi:putative SOS response-associated peptidase YedK